MAIAVVAYSVSSGRRNGKVRSYDGLDLVDESDGRVRLGFPRLGVVCESGACAPVSPSKSLPPTASGLLPSGLSGISCGAAV